MEEEVSENSEKSSECKIVFLTTLEEAQSLVRDLAKPCPPGDKTKAAIRRAYRRIGCWTQNRVRDVWYADRRIAVSGDEINHLRAVAAARRREGEARDYLKEFDERITRLEACLQVPKGQDLHRAAVDAGHAMARRHYRPVDGK
jgi:hypothetical protein